MTVFELSFKAGEVEAETLKGRSEGIGVWGKRENDGLSDFLRGNESKKGERGDYDIVGVEG